MFRLFRPIMALLCAATVLAPSIAQAPAASGAPASTLPDYTLQAGDQIGINVLGMKDFNVENTTVRPDGKISYPTIGDVYVVGMTPDQLSRVLTLGVGRFVKNPKVIVTVQTAVTQKYYVNGPVTKPGAFPLVNGTGVREAIAAAGDLTQTANQKSATVLREGQSIPIDLAGALAGDPAKNIPLQPGDTLKIDEALINVEGDAGQTGKQPLRHGTTLTQALAAVGGVKPDADVERVQIIRGGVGGQTTVVNLRDITKDPSKDVVLEPDDTIKIDAADVRNVPVFITGQVGKPGQYRYIPGYRDTLADAVEWAGGPVGDPDMARVKVQRTSSNGDTATSVYDLRTPQGRDVRLQPNDYVEVPKRRHSQAGSIGTSLLGVAAAFIGIFGR